VLPSAQRLSRVSPGETDDEFEELTDFIKDFRFDALGVLACSQEPDTLAGRMKEQILGEIQEHRVETHMPARQEVAFELAASRVGSRFEALVDGTDEDRRIVAGREGASADG